MNKTLLIEAHYLPCLEYFSHMLDHDVIFIESCESFQKQSYRNRCRIMSANKIDILSLPVINSGREVLIRDTKIDYGQKWLTVHWGAICSGYGKAPFFEYYSDYFQEILFKKHVFLFDLNIELMTLCLKLLGVDKKIEFSFVYNKNAEADMKDFRSQIHPKIDINTYIITWAPYNQLFGKQFVPNLSIIDLLFCEGPGAIEILRKSKKIMR